jgi:hypothetical protein
MNIMAQATVNVVKLPSSKQARPHATTKRAAKALRRQTVIAGVIGGTAVALTALSLHHLASGVQAVTASRPWESWAMAVGIDIGFIGAELSQVIVGEKLRKAIARYLQCLILGTLVMSAGMNVAAFTAHANGWLIYPGVLFGLAVPGLIYLTTRIAAAIYIDVHAKA